MTYEDYPDERPFGNWKRLCANPNLICLTRRIEEQVVRYQPTNLQQGCNPACSAGGVDPSQREGFGSSRLRSKELKFSKFEFRACRGWELLELKFRFVEADELRSSTRKLRLEITEQSVIVAQIEGRTEGASLVDDALITVEAVLVLFTPRRARLFLTQFETWILVVDTTTGRSSLNDELRSSHLYWTRRLRLPQLTVPSGAGCVSPIFGIASVPVRVLWPRIEARAQQPS
uniref:Uncharacterized protein n=1 Tax=Ananas comosus var. bracteatus TaxID=296719 RepID=A0A6V7PV95_ANACO|nr:unnamed protein product [Ananas comosus var. bracteatus]